MRRSSVEIHSRAEWKISDNGLLSGNAGSARGKDVNFNSKKKDQKEAEKMIPLKIASWGLFEAVWFIFQCCVFIAQVDMARAVAASFFFFFLWLCSVRGREELVYTQHLHTIRETLTVQMGGKKFSPVSCLVYEKHHYRAQNSLRDVLGPLAPEAILSPSPGYVR